MIGVVYDVMMQFSNIQHHIFQFYYEMLHIFYSYGFNRSEAEFARNEYQSLKTEVDQLSVEVAQLTKETNITNNNNNNNNDRGETGQDNAFYPLLGRCFSMEVRDYIYEFCPFNKVTQRGKQQQQQQASSSTTSLGDWVRWEQQQQPQNKLNTEASPPVFEMIMKYEGGLSCWNGPQRSSTVRVICGEKEELSNAEEPSICVYSFLFRTPAACTNEELQYLKEQLKQLQ